MDQENLQSKGFFSILGFSIRLIHSRRRLFLSLAAFALLPLAALALAGAPIAVRILDYEYDRENQRYSYRYSSAVGSFVFALVYGLVYLCFALLAAAAVLHAAASAYASKDAASLRKSLRAAPRAWPRLLGTSFWGLLMTIVYLFMGAIILGITVGIANAASGAAVVLKVLAIILVVIVAVLFFVGLVYVSAVWYLAIAATVLEGTGSGAGSSCWGFEAIRKGRALVRGRLFMFGALLVLLEGIIYIIQNICWVLTLYAGGITLGGRIVLGVIILCVLTGLFLLSLTVLAVAYLVLKASHGEPVDPVSLTARLDACAGEYERMVVPTGAGVGGHDNVQMIHQRV